MNKVDWIFWVSIEKREWFKNFWKSRGSNCVDIQIYNYHISIGLPWHKEVIRKADVNHPLEGITHIFRTNEQNRRRVEKWGRFRYISNKAKLCTIK
jgi:hypothetical protein